MDEMWVRSLCDAALADEPSIGPIARNSLRAGIALRRRRRARGALVSGLAVVAIAVAIPAVNQAVSGTHGTRGAHGTHSTHSTIPAGPVHALVVHEGAGLGSHGDWPVRLAFSPSGKLVVTADSDGTARLWSAATGREVGAPIRLSHARVEDVAFSPSGAMVATADSDGTARLWSAVTMRQVGAPIRVSSVQVISVAFSPDGRLLATIGVGWSARLWNVTTRRQVGAAMPSDMPLLDTLEKLTFSPNGKVLAVLGTGVTLWDVATQRLIGRARTLGTVSGLAFSSDNKILAAIGGLTELCQVTNQRCVAMGTARDGSTWGAFSSSGQILITVDSDGRFRQWSVATHRQIRPLIVLPHRPWGLLAAVLSPDRKILATTQFYGPARLWSLVDARHLRTTRPKFIV